VIAPAKLGDVVERIFRGVQIPADELDQITQPDAAVIKPYKILSIGDIQYGEVPIDLPLAYVEPSKRFDRYYLEPGDILQPARGDDGFRPGYGTAGTDRPAISHPASRDKPTAPPAACTGDGIREPL